MKVNAEHWLEPAEHQPIEGGSLQGVRRLLVIHFTAGATGQSSIDFWKREASGVCAHVVIERDGRVIQCRGFNRTCGHAGGSGKSRWRDPTTKEFYDGVNGCGSIGIEIANAGADLGALSWAKKQPGFMALTARHRNGGDKQQWEVFNEKQLAVVFEVSKVIVQRYCLDDLTGHDCIAPERRDDPGPAFPMESLREFCGFKGLPEVFQRA